MQHRSVAPRVDATGHLLIGIPVLVASALGLTLGTSRFIIALTNNLKEPPADWKPILLFTVMTGCAAFLILVVSAISGLVIGWILKALISRRRLPGTTRWHRHRASPAEAIRFG